MEGDAQVFEAGHHRQAGAAKAEPCALCSPHCCLLRALAAEQQQFSTPFEHAPVLPCRNVLLCMRADELCMRHTNREMSHLAPDTRR